MDDTTARHTDAPPAGTGGEDGTLSLARSVRGRYDRLSPLQGGGMVTGMERLQSMAEGGASLSMEIIGRWNNRDVPAVHGQLPFRAGIRRAAIRDGNAPGLRAADSEQSPPPLPAALAVVGTGSVSGRSAADQKASIAAGLQPRLSGSIGQALAGSPGAKAMNERLSRSAMPYAAASPAMAERQAEQTGAATGRHVVTGLPISTGRPAATDQPGAGTGAVPAPARNSAAASPSVQRAEAPMNAEAGAPATERLSTVREQDHGSQANKIARIPATERLSTAREQEASPTLPGPMGHSASLLLSPAARPAGARREVQLVRLTDTASRSIGNRGTEQAGESGEPSRLPQGSAATAGAAPSGKSPGIGASESRTVSGHDTPLPLSRAQETSTATVSAPHGPVPLASSAAPGPAAAGETAAPISARSFAKGQPYLLRRLPSAGSAGSAGTGSSQGVGSTTPGRHAEMRAAPVAVQRKTDGAATLSLPHRATIFPLPLQRDAVSAAPAEAEYPVPAASPAQAVAPSSRDRAVASVAGVLPLSARQERLNRTTGGSALVENGSGAAALAAAPRTPATLPLARMPGAVFRQISGSPQEMAGVSAGSSAPLQRSAEQETTSATGPATAPSVPAPAAPPPAASEPLLGGNPGGVDLERLADRVYAIIEQRLIIEKERRGL
ncbi:MAG: hypothetical protein HZC44_05275 [Geobacter sp.]|nr:hypothetical protein [Geobacter sp.]